MFPVLSVSHSKCYTGLLTFSLLCFQDTYPTLSSLFILSSFVVCLHHITKPWLAGVPVLALTVEVAWSPTSTDEIAQVLQVFY